MRTGKRQRGVVLISVLLIVALLGALIYQLVGRQTLLIAQARQTFAGDQALQYALGAEEFARQILYQEWTESGAVDNLTEVWAMPLAPLEVDEGFLEIQVRDLNSCFNLNSVASVRGGGGGAGTGTGGGGGGSARQNLTRFKTLLRNANLPETHAETWLDWIDPDQEISGFGAEDSEYLLGEFPHRTADQLAGHVSELRMLREMDPELLEALEPHLCVLPTETLKLNVNTATAAALAALSPTLAEAQILAMTESERTYEDVAEVTAEYPELAAAVDALSVASEYFEIQIRAQVDDSLVELSSVLHRGVNDGTITVLTRDFGKRFRSRFVDDLSAGGNGDT
jgi:general secretion pathway protein K